MARHPPFAKGNPGRPRGVPNKMTSDIRAMLRAALDELGGLDYIVAQAKTNPQAFLQLIGKLIPAEIVGAGGDGSHIVRVITGVPPPDDIGKQL